MDLHSLGLFAILGVMFVSFITHRVGFDTTVIGALLAMVLGGYLHPDEIFTGFSSPVVVIMVCTFFVAGALRRNGVTETMARWILRFGGDSEGRVITMVVLVAAFVSAFMNNVSATALLMPAISSLAHETMIPASRLYIPLAFGTVFGGMTTIIGTPPNILGAEMLRKAGYIPFDFFAVTPFGLASVFLGALLIGTIGRRMLPLRKNQHRLTRMSDLRKLYNLDEQLISMRVKGGGAIAGRTLSELRIGEIFDGIVVTIVRGERKFLAPLGSERLESGDLLLIKGSFERLQALEAMRGLEVGPLLDDLRTRICAERAFAEFDFTDALEELDLDTLGAFENHFDILVTELTSENDVSISPRLAARQRSIRSGDTIGGFMKRETIGNLAGASFAPSIVDLSESDWSAQFYLVEHPPANFDVEEFQIRTRHRVVGILDAGGDLFWGPTFEPKEEKPAAFIVAGDSSMARHRALLANLELETQAQGVEFDSIEIGVVELVVPPRSDVVNKSIADLHFRERYDCQVLAVWREGRPHIHRIAQLPLKYGDALLVQGPRQKFPLLAKDRDFLLLSEVSSIPRLSWRSLISIVALFLLVLLPLSTNLPVVEVAFISAALVVLSGAIHPEEAYREIEWRVVFLLAMLLPIGQAVADANLIGPATPALQTFAAALPDFALIAVLLIVSSIISQLMDGSVAVVILAPLAIALARALGASPYPLVMAVTLGASLAFMAPFSSRANVLVMGAGGYRSRDYIRIGTMITAALVVLFSVMIPVILPFYR